ncbi:M15 family metallopeptidase [Vagococcus vulneris]|uniref:D-alanyl-D-alanine carboxypeptidase-like core domain-containing protein n=1 Tax=Vagococcus vulneris TaxID=1977869 RepID=A0A429ZXU5_9ENTE|nr:M15 family metallopeptidase [Vagococcus vulneris]RST98729.1 hypothetical protein CBF37_06680 [Vagococcus vulneris]
MAKKLVVALIGLVLVLLLIFMHPTSRKAQAIKNKSSEITTEKNTKTSVQKVEKPKFPGTEDDWELELVNNSHKVRAEPTDLAEVGDGKKVDRRIEGSFMELRNGAKAAGIELTVVSGYRSVAEQTAIVNQSINNYLSQGLSEDEAKKKTFQYMTEPGHSEHHTGLAVDVVDTDWDTTSNGLEADFYNTKGGKWLDEHVIDYGFVIRYPKGKEAVTEINYEPWHLRYVGKENAKYMKEHDLTLEEYTDQLKE